MFRQFCHGFVTFTLIVSVSASEIGYTRCNCDGDNFWDAETILRCQKAADFLIAASYFSIPLELLYFFTCANLFPFKWIVFQFGAFIVMCGLTHLLNVFTYGPHSFLVMLSLTISKFFTALISFATVITLLTLIPQLLRVKVRENFLRIKASQLDREVGMMKRHEEASWRVRMLTQEIRKSLDRHTILYTTLVKLSNTLGLQNCAVWMPDDNRRVMTLTHESSQRSSSDLICNSVPVDDPDVVDVTGTNGAKLLNADSKIGSASSGMLKPGAIAAIRMPLLKVSNFKGGTPEIVKASYAILVLVLPADDSRYWSNQELEIVEVVADRVAVALSHAAVLEESQLMREKLAEQNRALLLARQSMLMASEARNNFEITMNRGMRVPIHSILGLLSIMQQENMIPEQRLILDATTKSSGVVSTLINDVMESNNTSNEQLSLVMRPFNLHSMLKEAVSASRCLCYSKGLGFQLKIETMVPEQVVGDENRIFQVILYMVGSVLNGSNEGFLAFRILRYDEAKDEKVQDWMSWNSKFFNQYTCLRFEVTMNRSQNDNSCSSQIQFSQGIDSEGIQKGLSFRMCKRVVQMMQGNLWTFPSSEGVAETIIVDLQLRLQPTNSASDPPRETQKLPSSSFAPNFKGLRVLLAENDHVNRTVTRKLLEKIGFHVSSVMSGAQCLSSFTALGTPFQVVILDLHMPEMDGFEVANRLRQFGSRGCPVIVALTASAESEVWERCFQSGMNGLIRKPITLHTMGDELYRVLKNS